MQSEWLKTHIWEVVEEWIRKRIFQSVRTHYVIFKTGQSDIIAAEAPEQRLVRNRFSAAAAAIGWRLGLALGG
jgi:hypothetical protein